MASREAHFTLEHWTDDGWYVGQLREIPAVMSQGETLRHKVRTKEIRLSLA